MGVALRKTEGGRTKVDANHKLCVALVSSHERLGLLEIPDDGRHVAASSEQRG